MPGKSICFALSLRRQGHVHHLAPLATPGHASSESF